MIASVSPHQRYTRTTPCPVCGGDAMQPHGQGRRCHGFLSSDGPYALCSRDEHSGGLQAGSAGLYMHYLKGSCRCGRQHAGHAHVNDDAPAAKAAKSAEAAAAIWGNAVAALGTPVELYLRARGMTSLPSVLCYAPALWHAESGQRWPGMVAAVQRPGVRNIVAVHRTFLTKEGTKAPVEPVKKMLGPTGGGAVRLRRAGPVLVIAEGIETALSVQEATGLPAWAALSAGGVVRLVLPDLPLAAEVIIAADADAAGMKAAYVAAMNRDSQGRRVRIAAPPKGDFNDLLTRKQST